MPARFAELGDLHQGIDDSAYSLDTLLNGQNATDSTSPAGHPAVRCQPTIWPPGAGVKSGSTGEGGR